MDILNKIKINEKEYDMNSYSTELTKQKYIESFGDISYKKEVRYNINNIDGFFFEILGDDYNHDEFNLEISDSNEVVFKGNIKPNNWVKLNRKYYSDWNVKLSNSSNILLNKNFSLSGKRVFITFESRSLGDNIAWIPYCEEFRKKHNCELIVCTFWNKFFIKKYKNIQFVEPGSVVNNIHSLYRIGWFWDKDKEPEKPNTIPLQKAASNILGLEFKEIKSDIYYEPKKIYDFKYVTIATHSTAGCKYWHYPNGWQEIVDYLDSLGYKVVHVSKESTDLNNVIELTDTSIENTMSAIHYSEFFIGLSSGLSWLSWAMNKHVVMISNFTEYDHEFTINTTRITNPKVCNGCWNNPMFKFDKGDWYWCPEHKDTPRHFECHKSITPEMVINKIQHLLK